MFFLHQQTNYFFLLSFATLITIFAWSCLNPITHCVVVVVQIPVVADLPVGENLQDHVMTLLRVLIDQPLSTSPEKLAKPWTKWQYDMLKTGV